MKILSLAKLTLRRMLFENGILINKADQVDALRKFMHSVQPMATQFELIRVGSDGDGGYLVPDDLIGIGPCFSPGVSSSANFELDLARRGIRSFLADYSVDSAPVENPLLSFRKKFLGPVDDEVYIRLSTWVEECAGDSNDLILQMDIEGDEYTVFLDSDDDLLRRFRIIVVEFHALDHLADKFSAQFVKMVFDKLLRLFEVVHIHPNNCCTPYVYKGVEVPPVLEFTFLRKDRALARTPISSFPHPLDRANVAAQPDFPLPACWYEVRPS